MQTGICDWIYDLRNYNDSKDGLTDNKESISLYAGNINLSHEVLDRPILCSQINADLGNIYIQGYHSFRIHTFLSRQILSCSMIFVLRVWQYDSIKSSVVFGLSAS